ncbi:MAG: FtsQ-type POTRA domain-containing protein [Dehalococcoidia bacterium]
MDSKRAAMRPGYRWQPKLIERGPKERRSAGRRKLSMPKLRIEMPYLAAYWRQVAIAVVVACALGAGSWWLYHSPLLAIGSVSVEGNYLYTPQQVREFAALSGQSLIRPDFGAAEQRLLAQPMVKEAHVSRDWPRSVKVTIVERAPWGIWQVGDQRFVIDAEGVVLDLPVLEGLPVIAQTDVSQAPAQGQQVDLGAVSVATRLVSTAQPTLGRSVVGLEFSQARGLIVVFDGNLRVTFGDAQDYDYKVAALFEVLQRASAEGRTLTSVDLRFGDRVAAQ